MRREGGIQICTGIGTVGWSCSSSEGLSPTSAARHLSTVCEMNKNVTIATLDKLSHGENLALWCIGLLLSFSAYCGVRLGLGKRVVGGFKMIFLPSKSPTALLIPTSSQKGTVHPDV